MEKGWVSQREYHEKSGRAFRKDKSLTDEDKKEKAKVKSAEWRLRNPRAGWAARHLPVGVPHSYLG